MDFFKGIGNFFGNLFGGNDEKKKKQQPRQTYQAPAKAPSAAPVSFNVGQNRSRNDDPLNLMNQQPINGLNLNLPGMTQKDSPGFPVPLKKAAAKPAPKKEEPNPVVEFGKKIVSGVQQGAGRVADVAVMGGTVLGDTGIRLNPFKSNERKEKEALENYYAGEALRKKIKDAKTVTGESLNPTPDYNPTGNLKRDAADLAGRGLQVGLDATSFINPASLVKSAGGATVKTVGKQAAKEAALYGGGQGAATAAQVYGQGGTGQEALTKGSEAGLLSGVTQAGLIGAGFGGGKLLQKARGGGPTPEPDIAPGVKSTNPNREADAAKAAEEQAVKEAAMVNQQLADNTPSYQKAPLKKAQAAADEAATNVNAKALGLGDTELDTTPAFQHKRDMKAVVDQGEQELNDFINANPGATRQDIEAAQADINEQVVSKLSAMRDQRAAAVAPVEPEVRTVESAPVATEPDAFPMAPQAAAPVIPAADDVVPVTSGEVAPVAPATPAPAEVIPTIPETNPAAGGLQVPIAPRTREAAMKQIGDMAREIPGTGEMRDVTNLDELKTSAQGVIENIPDDELAGLFSSRNIEAMPNDSKSFAVIRAARDRLSQIVREDPTNADAKDALASTIDEMASRASGGGELLRVVQEEFDAMPLEAKVRYLARKIDAANRDTKGYEPLARDPAKLGEIEAALTARLQATQDVAEQIAGIENQINNAADAAKQGISVNIKDAVKLLKEKQTELQIKNGEVVKYFQDLVPGRTKAQKALVDFPKRMMLSSFAGRVNDIVTTAANIGKLETDNITQGLIAKGVNLVKGKGTVTDTFRGGSRVLGGIKSGLQKFKGEVQGKQYVDDVQGSLKGNEDLRSNLRKANGPISRTIQAATEAATNVSTGVRDQRLYQLADQEAAKAGLTGKMRQQYAEARSAVPTRQMLENAENLHMQMNNLNDNPVSRALNGVARAMEGDNKFAQSGVGGIIKNQILPFTSWLGGNIWNSVTDKNVVANTFKFFNDARKGDTEGAVRNLAAAINGAAMAYGIGYSLAKAGVLTNEDAEGYSDGGMYVHIGDRYVPVGFFGFFAPNIVLGKMAHDGLTSDDPAGAIASDLANYAMNGLGVSTALGVENTATRAYDAWKRPGGDIGDAGAVAGAGAVGQFIPSLGGDVNAVLNNGVSLGGQTIIPDTLNPTHEAADTKVVNPNSPSGTAKDYPKSALAGLQNRIPFASQQLPRKKDVAADDMVDRITRGNRDTPGGKAAKEQAKTEAGLAADRKKRGVPETDEAAEVKWQNGEFDSAIEGYKYLMNKKDAEGKLSKSDRVEFEKKINRAQVMKDNGIEYEDWSQYDKMGVEEWRKLADPESDSYDLELYQRLYDIDKALSDAKAGDKDGKPDKPKYYAKESKAKGGGRGGSGGGGSGGANSELARIRSNTLGDTPSLAKVSLGDLRPEKAGSVKAAPIKALRSSDLVKKRKITVGKA